MKIKKISKDKIIRRAFAQVAIFAIFMMLSPLPAFAAGYCSSTDGGSVDLNNSNVADVLKFGTCLIEGAIIPLLFAFATAVFIYGVVMFMKEDKAEEKEKGRQFMLWGIIAFSMMWGVWGFVAILSNTFGVTDVLPTLPQEAT